MYNCIFIHTNTLTYRLDGDSNLGKEFGNVVIVLGLEDVDSHGISQVVLGRELADVEVLPLFSLGDVDVSLVEVELAGLLVQQEGVTVETGAQGSS